MDVPAYLADVARELVGDRNRVVNATDIFMDIIPVSAGPFCCANAEDGVVLADAVLRQQLAQAYPAMWQRMMARREFMRQSLGIQIHESVLPLSNMPGWLPPYALDLDKALVKG